MRLPRLRVNPLIGKVAISRLACRGKDQWWCLSRNKIRIDDVFRENHCQCRACQREKVTVWHAQCRDGATDGHILHSLKEEPIVLQTHNDLVFWCTSRDFQRDYYICNPYTMQWVALPPPATQCHENVRVEFICDVPYYSCKKDDQKGHFVQLNVEYISAGLWEF